ncbi:MAG: hypothetical protein WCH85_03565 [Methanomicrobiales archaeon]
MTITNASDNVQHRLGWCPNTPVISSASAVLLTEPAFANPLEPDGGAGGSARVARGIRFATGSIRILINNKRLLWFSFLTGFVILFMIAAEMYFITHLDLFTQLFVAIPFGESFRVFDFRLFLLQATGLFGINILLAALILSVSTGNFGKTLAFREGLTKVWSHTGSLAGWSVIMAFLVTVIYTFVSQDPFIGSVVFRISMAAFYLPFAYYIPDAISSALFFVCYAMFVDIILFVLTLFVVPFIVLENKSLPGAIAGSFLLLKKTWREILGSVLVLGMIALGISSIAFVICSTPLLLNHDYDFFLQISRGRLLMTIVCFAYVIGWWILMTIGSTVVGITTSTLYHYGRTGWAPDRFEILGDTSTNCA